MRVPAAFAGVTCSASRWPKRVHRDVGFPPIAAFMAIVARARAALRRTLDRSRIEDDGRRIIGASVGPAQERAQIMHHRFKAASGDPALGLLIDRRPRREVGRQHPPLGTSAHDPAQPIENFTQIVAALRGLFDHQGQVGGDERPLLVAHIGRVRFAGILRFHAPSLTSA